RQPDVRHPLRLQLGLPERAAVEPLWRRREGRLDPRPEGRAVVDPADLDLAVHRAELALLPGGPENIPKEIEEAAIIDGAGKWAMLWGITLPMLRPVVLFVVVQAINGSYQLFAQPLLLTGGGPSDATVTMTLYLYETGFQYFNLGYA